MPDYSNKSCRECKFCLIDQMLPTYLEYDRCGYPSQNSCTCRGLRLHNNQRVADGSEMTCGPSGRYFEFKESKPPNWFQRTFLRPRMVTSFQAEIEDK